MGRENPWLSRRVLNFAHQGGAREAPSSTLHALRQAVERGATAIELDVHCSADGELVVCHDSTVDRTTPRCGRIADLTLAELRDLDNAYWWVPGEQAVTDAAPESYVLRGRAPADRALGVATLREVLLEFPHVFVNLDIKETFPTVPGYEALLADLLRLFGRVDDVIVASFLDEATARFSAYAPEVHTSVGTNGTYAFFNHARFGADPPPLRSDQVALQPPATFQGITVVDEQFVAAAHTLGLAVHVWTIDDPAEMGRLLSCGVDGIITDLPSVLDGVLRRSEAGI